MLNRFLNIAYPPVCEGCGEAYFKGDIPGVYQTCHDEKLYPLTYPYCPDCGQNYPGKMPNRQCSNCSGRSLDFDFALGAYMAEGKVMDWIHRFKYLHEIHFARTFGKLMSRIWDNSRFRPFVYRLGNPCFLSLPKMVIIIQ